MLTKTKYAMSDEPGFPLRPPRPDEKSEIKELNS